MVFWVTGASQIYIGEVVHTLTTPYGLGWLVAEHIVNTCVVAKIGLCRESLETVFSSSFI